MNQVGYVVLNLCVNEGIQDYIAPSDMLCPTWLRRESGLWVDSEGCPAVGGGVSLRGDKPLKRALSHPRCILIHTASTKPPSPILAFLQLARPGNEYDHVCLIACVVFLSSEGMLLSYFYSNADLIFKKSTRKDLLFTLI